LRSGGEQLKQGAEMTVVGKETEALLEMVTVKDVDEWK
jgi:hypothetical protein